MSGIGNGEKDIGVIKKIGIILFLFSSFFGVIILIDSNTPEGLYLGWTLLTISFIVIIIWIMWKIAGKLDEMVSKITEPESSYQIESETIDDDDQDIKENKQMSNSKILVIGITLAVILFWVTTIT